MSNSTAKKVGILAAITLVLTSWPPVADSGILPAFDAMINYFPDASEGIMNFIMSGAALFSVPAGILSGLLVKKMSKKTMLLVTMVTFILSTALGGIVENLMYMAVMRAISGASYGAMTTASLGLIAELYPGDKECSRMMGLYNGIQAGGGTIMALAGGVLAVSYWSYPFLMFWVCVPLAVMILIFIPKTPPESAAAEVSDGEEGSSGKMPWLKVIAMSAAGLIVGTIYCTLYMEISIYLGELNIGNASTAGLISAAGTLGSFLIGFVFSPIYVKFKRFTPVVFTAVIAIVFVVYSFKMSPIVLTVAWAFAGAAYGTSLSYYFTHITTFVPSNQQSLAIAIVNAAVNLGMSASVYAISAVKGIVKVDTFYETLPYFTAMLVVGIVLSVILGIRDKKMQAK